MDEFDQAQQDIRDLRERLIKERREMIANDLATHVSRDGSGKAAWQHINRMIGDLELIEIEERKLADQRR